MFKFDTFKLNNNTNNKTNVRSSVVIVSSRILRKLSESILWLIVSEALFFRWTMVFFTTYPVR